MCIIVAKPQGVQMPNMETLRGCWNANPHGAGIMYAYDNKVRISKGLMTWDAFVAELAAISGTYSINRLGVVLHFRISTQAGVNPENTHPFPITNNALKLSQFKTSSKIGGVAHNGIIPCCTSRSKAEKHSDTYYFVKDYVSRLIARPSQLRETWMQITMRELAQSKLAFLLPDGEIITIGKFEKQADVLYSNRSYEEERPKYMTMWEKYDDLEAMANTEDLYPCTEGMCYYDEDDGDYYECFPELDMFDDFGELWRYDEETNTYQPMLFPIFDENMFPVHAPAPSHFVA